MFLYVKKHEYKVSLIIINIIDYIELSRKRHIKISQVSEKGIEGVAEQEE